jgi:hypothetical protein
MLREALLATDYADSNPRNPRNPRLSFLPAPFLKVFLHLVE